MSLRKWFNPDILWGLGMLIVLSLPFAFSNLDLSLSGLFYNHGWNGGDRQPWIFLYRYGVLPGLLISAAALIVFLGSWVKDTWQAWRRPAAIILIALILGPGLLVNTFGKGYWGRPRPRDVAQFQGSETFHRFIQPGTPGQGKSFPCGHASVGFLLVVFFFLDSNRKRRWLWLGTGLGYGTLMGVARMAQGGHFASDVLWSGGLTYLSAAAAHHLILPAEWGQNRPAALRKELHWLAWLGISLGISGLAAFFLLATPYSKEWDGRCSAPRPITAVRIDYPDPREQVQIVTRPQTDAIQAYAVLQGFGFPKLHVRGVWQVDVDGTTLNARLTLKFDRWVTERKGNVIFYVQEGLQVVTGSKTGD